jgi:hypothetical protein
MRIEPPISVPIPSMLPPEATKAPSPPEDPPEMRSTLKAFTLCPKTWLYESDIYWVLFFLFLITWLDISARNPWMRRRNENEQMIFTINACEIFVFT